MNIVITGATGFIGTRLANRLSAEGHAVTALVRHESPLLSDAVARCHGALSDRESLRQAVAGADAVVHVAGRTKAFTARGFLRVNEDLTQAVAEVVDRFAPPHAALLYVSSQAAVGPCNEPPGLRETDQPAPVSYYGFSKLLGERAVLALAARRPVAVARPSMVYGPGDAAFAPLYRCMQKGFLPAAGPAGQRFSIVHVDDLVEGLMLAVASLGHGRANARVLHFAGPQSFVWEDYAEAFGLALERRVRVLRTRVPALYSVALGNTLFNALGLPTLHLTFDKCREALAPGWLLDCARTVDSIGYVPRRGLVEGAAETLAWCREKGLLRG